MKLLFHNQEQQYQLLLDEATDEYILDVLCGRVGMYGVQVKLTNVQTQAYEEQGVTVLDDFARQVWQEEDRKLLERRRLQAQAVEMRHWLKPIDPVWIGSLLIVSCVGSIGLYSNDLWRDWQQHRFRWSHGIGLITAVYLGVLICRAGIRVLKAKRKSEADRASRSR